MNSAIEKIKLDIKWNMASRSSVLMLSISFIISDILFPLLIYGIYQNYKIPGWNIYQILSMYGIFMFIYGFTDSFFNSFRWELTDDIKNGRFDYWLVRPKHVFRLMGISLFVPSLNDIITGIILMVLFIGSGNLINLFLLISLGILFLAGFSILIVGLTFKFVSLDNLWNLAEDFFTTSHWPNKIFPYWIRIFVMIFPFVLVGYAPAYAYFFGDLNKFLIPIISSIALFVFSIFYFNYSMKKYSSAGG